MTITFETPNGQPLAGRSDRRVFTATKPLAFACAVFATNDGILLDRAQEVVFRDDAFQAPYDKSTKVGNVYTVVRAGGWPTGLVLRVEERVSQVLEGSYLPPLYGVTAQYALDPAAIAPGVLRDRSGNGFHLENINPGSYSQFPTPVPGKNAPLAASMARSSFPNMTREMSIVCLVYSVALTPTPYGRVVINFGAGTSYQTPIQLGASNVFFSYMESAGGPGTGTGHSSNLYLPVGRWMFTAVRRRADGRVLWNLGDDQVLSAGVVQPFGNIAGAIYINANSYGTGNDGATADVNLWSGRCLTDAELLDVRTQMGMAA